MDELGVYVVRVYRRDPSGIDGVIEAVNSGEQLRFHSSDELWHALYDLPLPRRRSQPQQRDEEDQS